MELPVVLRRFGAISGTLLLLISQETAAGVGRTPGFASVSHDGEAEYTIPIVLPPGTNGMTPVLSLEYRHRTQGGLVGIGWSIGGLSQITRCAATIAQDGFAARPNMTLTDRFCLDGQRLAVINSLNYGAAPAEYRTEIESFARIRSHASATNGPEDFVVEAADGRIYEYGATPDSRIDGRASTTSIGARTWALNRIRNRSGNVIDYSYFEERPGASFRISSIRYNANPSAGVNASHEVSFGYENRPSKDVDTGYVAGAPIRQIVRLDRIDVLYNGTILRRYELNYEPALSANGRSRLASVQECAGSTNCLAATTFDWQDGVPGFAAATASAAVIPGPVSSVGHQYWNTADLNGDGRPDYIWAGGTAITSATIRYRLGLAGGAFGPEINSGIPCPNGIGMPFDSNGDGNQDLLMVSSGIWTIVPGRSTGLGTAVTTSIAIPPKTMDYRGLDLNGDGLGDIAWSELADPNSNTVEVRARYALRSGGFAAPVVLSPGFVSQVATPGRFMGRPGRRIDLNGDGADELLLDEHIAIAHVSNTGHAVTYFDNVISGGTTLDFNDDDCTDFAYKHSTGTLRVRIGGCGTHWGSTELLGPAWSSGFVLSALDWNGDGRDDLLLTGTTNWHVAVSNGDSLAAIADSGIAYEGVPIVAGIDADGNGLQDLLTRNSNQFRLRLKNGVKADLMTAAKDGFGVSAEFSYSPLIDAAIYMRGTGAIYPEQDVQTTVHVVSKLTTTDGSGRGSKSSSGFRYEGLRQHLLGRGSLGFRKLIRADLTPEHRLSTEITRRQDFPFSGLPESVVVRQESGKPVFDTRYQWSSLGIAGIPASPRFPYPSTITSRRYEAGGSHDSAEIARRVQSVAAIDAKSGLATDQTMTVTEVASGVNAGASASFRTLHTDVLNDTANWCLGRSQGVRVTASHTLATGAPITREASQVWDGAACRPTQRRLEPGDSQWQVTYDLAYDAFGNVRSEKITGAGMNARAMAIAWDARGQFPIRIGNPLGQLTRLSWDSAAGLPLTLTDPNGLTTRWLYDVFGRPTRETQPDGTSTTWSRDVCNSGCDPRAKILLTQEDRDNGGTVRVTSFLEIDQHGRAFRMRNHRPGGGRSISTIDSNDRGLVSRQYLPYWEGDSPAGYWQFSYDALGRKTDARLMAIDGVVERSTRMRYDGLALTQTDAMGRDTTAIRTAWGRLTEIVDAIGGSTRHEHDAFGNLVRVRDSLNNNVATIGYNPRGLKLTHNDADMGSWTWTRNALGETTSLRDAKGQVSVSEYDALGRVTKRVAPDGTGIWAWGDTAASKNVGRLSSIAGPGYREQFTYDPIGRPATRTIVTDSTYRYDYNYNSLGLLDSITYPASGSGSPFKIRHDYDAGQVSRIKDAYASGDIYWTLNSQDAAGNLLDESLGTAARVVSSYDPISGMLEYRQSGVGSGASVQNLAYAWDANGNLTRRNDLNQALVEEFRHDKLDRLEESRRNGVVNLEVDYDLIGNIRRKSDVCAGAAPCFGYHASRKHAVISAGGRSYAYDANGNMTNRGGVAIAWTSDNLPASIGSANGNNSQFSYGPASNRWKQVAKLGTTNETTIYAGELLEKVARGGATTWRHYILAPTGTVALHLRYSGGTPPATRYLTQDHLGSTDRILDAEGNVAVAESFNAFGQRRRVNWTGVPGAVELGKIASMTRDGYTGHEHLDNLDLIHMNGRIYDPRLGRFISADPYVTLPHDGQSLNRYAYVLNNPLSLIDPSGFDPPPCMESSAGVCAQITVIGVEWADWIRYIGGGAAQVASARERDPCGQESDALTCSMQFSGLVSPASIVLTVGTRADSTLARSRTLDSVQGFAARIGNLAISSSPVAMLFGADPDFQWFDEPDSEAGRSGSNYGNIGYLLGGFGGIIRKTGAEIAAGAPSRIARSMQGNIKYPGIDRFKNIVLKKGTIVYAGFPGQGAFYTTAGALRRSGQSASVLFGGLQIAPHASKSPRVRAAAYEVMEDTRAAFGLAISNPKHGEGWLPQVVVPSYQTTLRFISDFPLGP